MEALAVPEAVIRALSHGRSARDGAIVLEGVFGVTLTINTGGSVEVVPSLVRGVVVMWTPFVSARGSLHCDLDTDDGELTRTAVLGDAVAQLERWPRARGPVGLVAARLAPAAGG